MTAPAPRFHAFYCVLGLLAWACGTTPGNASPAQVLPDAAPTSETGATEACPQDRGVACSVEGATCETPDLCQICSSSGLWAKETLACTCKGGDWSCASTGGTACMPGGVGVYTDSGCTAQAPATTNPGSGSGSSSSCPFPDFTRDYPVPADAGAPLADGGLDCMTLCPDPGPVMAGPGVPVSCAIVKADGGTVLECVYRPSCI